MGLGEQYELEKTGRIEPENYPKRQKQIDNMSKINPALPAKAQFEIFYDEVAEALEKLDSSHMGLNMIGKLELVKGIIKKHGQKTTEQTFKIIEEQGPKLEPTTRKMTDDNYMYTLDRVNALEEYYARIYDTMIACGHDVGGEELPSILQMVCDVIEKCRTDAISGKRSIDHDKCIKYIKVLPGYEGLFRMLEKALNQSQIGKGKERHANDDSFEEQPICTEIPILGLGAPAYQVRKKCRESIRILEKKGPEAAIHEVCGVIVYAAAMMLHMESLTEKK